ncbi:HrpE/YscL family type III secretion apparatus protein [Succinatimonas hippei]|uniref:HrpE/YscL family type III secretion apparatus protein n=1 Tax=Succinatimonas hippei TaxID=626938 RepID=UPI002011C635|nr:HrpE/YscL family type III secretion apparatus protein [Succinatimonas hippei]MCL1603327.1 HrpE/YscL family type III secretion apparatus protein [Succinatimonas hippei]MDM8120032.1 HrpE/YscL family type III secretion apparatus protein [Succinatimonas hippei]
MEKIFHLDADDKLQIADDVKIIRKDDLEKFFAAEEIILESKKKAQEILDKAEEIYKNRFEQGLTEGKEEGKSEYTFKIMDMVLSQVDSLESLEKQLVEVVTKSVNKIIGDLDEKDRIVRVVRKGLSAVRGEKRIVVRVSTHDEPIVREDLKAYLLSDDGRSGYIEVIGDVNLKKGDCILETQMGVVEASLDTQLKILSESLSARVASKD